jgi:predicted AAA+ superfamily ATPase
VLQAYRELYPETGTEACYFFFDEIQNIEGWDTFIRRVYDSGTKNIFITGSNSASSAAISQPAWRQNNQL